MSIVLLSVAGRLTHIVNGYGRSQMCLYSLPFTDFGDFLAKLFCGWSQLLSS